MKLKRIGIGTSALFVSFGMIMLLGASHVYASGGHGAVRYWSDGMLEIHKLYTEKHTKNYWNGKTKHKSKHAVLRVYKLIALKTKGPKRKSKAWKKFAASLPKKGNFKKSLVGDKTVHYGVQTWFWPNGNLQATVSYCTQHSVRDDSHAHGHGHGKDANANKCHYGKKHGASINYYANGKKRWEVPYTNGKKNGAFVEWYTNGRKKLRVTYSAGKKQGTFTMWWWNGRKAKEGSYDGGKKTGTWREWYSNGKLKFVRTYRGGKLQGLAEDWWWVCRPAGCVHKRMVRGIWRDGKKDGYWSIWSLDNNNATRQKWSKGQRQM